MSPDGRGREIFLPETSTVAELAPRVEVTSRELINTAFNELGFLLTIDEPLPFERSRALVEQFGFVARRSGPAEGA